MVVNWIAVTRWLRVLRQFIHEIHTQGHDWQCGVVSRAL